MKHSQLKQIIKEELQKILSENTLNYSQLKKTLNESPYPLIPKKMLLADILELNDIPDSEFGDQNKDQAVNFIRIGRPSEVYLEKIISILKKHNVDTSEVEAVETGEEKGWDMRVSKDINPNEDNPMRGRIGGIYRGD